jgi:hypothetical protein
MVRNFIYICFVLLFGAIGLLLVAIDLIVWIETGSPWSVCSKYSNWCIKTGNKIL